MSELKRFSYMARDYESIISDCAARIKAKYPDTWNDFYEDNLGVVILEVFGYLCDTLLFYGDRQAIETYLATATERQNVINIAAAIGYRVAGASPSTADITFSMDEARSRDVTVPAGTQIATQEGVVFELIDNVVISAGNISATGGARQGITYSEFLGTSSGDAGQSYFIDRQGIVAITAVYVGGVAWEPVDSLFEQEADSRAYKATLNSDGTTQVAFGDGDYGAVPPQGEDIEIVYRVCSGARGNVLAGTITIMRDVATDTAGDRGQVTATNASAATGGVDQESLTHIKNWAPKYYETQDRCVTQNDYETRAIAFDGGDAGRIAKCRAVVTEQTGAANVITLYVLAYSAGGGLAIASQALKDALYENISQYKMLTDWIEVDDGVIVPVDISGYIKMMPGFRESTVAPRVTAALEGLFNPEIRQMGQAMRISDLYGVIEGAEGVDYVELSSPLATITPADSSVLTLGAISLTYSTQV